MARSQVVRENIERALMNFDPIRTGDTAIDVDVENGTVILSGYVQTNMMKSVVAQLVTPVLQGRQLRNNILSDADLEIRVASALEMVSQGYLMPVPIQVRILRGYAILRGNIPSEEARTEIERLTHQVPGVVGVQNLLEVDPISIERLVAPKKVATKRKSQRGGGGAAMVGGKTVTAADLPAWAMKPKAEWSMADYKARAKTKMAFKAGAGPDPKEMEDAGAILRGGGAADDTPEEAETLAEEYGVTGITAQPPELVNVPAAASTPAAAVSDPARPTAADTSDLPSWALKPKEQWSKEEFQANAKAKSAFKKGEGPNPDDLMARGATAASAGPLGGDAVIVVSPPTDTSTPTVDMGALRAKYPAWALKPKEEWTPEEFKAQAAAKSAAKKGEGPDPKTIIEEAQAAINAAKAAATRPVATSGGGASNGAAAALAAVRAQYPGWALKPRREWTAQDFREAADAKVAELRAQGKRVKEIRDEAQGALEAAKRGEVSGGAATGQSAKRELTPAEIEAIQASLAAQFPSWAFKPKEAWTPEEFKAQAAAKSAAKKGEGADPKVIIEQAQAAFEQAKAEALKQAGSAAPAPAAAPAAARQATITPELLAKYPGWALKPKEAWTPDEFKAHAKAKSAFKKGEGPDPDAVTAEAQAALA